VIGDVCGGCAGARLGLWPLRLRRDEGLALARGSSGWTNIGSVEAHMPRVRMRGARAYPGGCASGAYAHSRCENVV